MTRKRSIRKRNVEDIRRKNLVDNQLFLKELLLTNVREDFLKSARSILRKNENKKIPIQREKIEYATRYNAKVKSGEIQPFIPQLQEKNNPNPYGRIFKARCTETDKRIQQDILKLLKQRHE